MNRRRIVFFDTETTGLDPTKHEVLEIAWKVTTPDGRDVVEEVNLKVLPEHIETAEPSALEVNGYKPELWTRDACITQQELATRFKEVSENAVLAGHGVNFDEGFMKALLLRFNLAPAWHYQSIDTQKMAWPLYLTNRIPGVSLRHVATYFGLSQPEPHRAATDTDVTYQVFHRLLTVYTRSLEAA